jgi:hypothetical protein
MSTTVLCREPAPAISATPAAWAAALFTSDLSALCEHTPIEVATAIEHAIGVYHGIGGCVAEMAAAYGEHPETATRRMRWARTLIAGNAVIAGNTVIAGSNAPAGWLRASA